MTKHQTRRSLSVRGDTYAALLTYAHGLGRSVSQVVEEQLAKVLPAAPRQAHTVPTVEPRPAPTVPTLAPCRCCASPATADLCPRCQRCDPPLRFELGCPGHSTARPPPPRCTATTAAGSRCTFRALSGGLCTKHLAPKPVTPATVRGPRPDVVERLREAAARTGVRNVTVAQVEAERTKPKQAGRPAPTKPSPARVVPDPWAVRS